MITITCILILVAVLGAVGAVMFYLGVFGE